MMPALFSIPATIVQQLSSRCCTNLLASTTSAAGKIIEVLQKHGLQRKVALLVTDQAAAMVNARCQVVGAAGFEHMLHMR